MTKINVLVFPCGSENALEIHNALKYSVNINVVGASSSDDHGRFVYKNYVGSLPYIQDADFIECLNKVLVEKDIQVIFPTHDTVAVFLAENKEKIKAKIVTADLYTATVCRHKAMMYQLFSKEDFCPKVFDRNEAREEDLPLFVKPDIGEGGKNAKKINSMNELSGFTGPGWVFLEYLPYEEVTVDCFTDRRGKLRFIGPRIRARVNNGISVRSATIEADAAINGIAETVNNKLKFRGLWFFQLKRDSDRNWKLLEVSARASGTMSLYRNAGVNLPLLTVYDWMDRDVELHQNNYLITVDRALFNRYEISFETRHIYIDFDDTVTLNGKVNPFIMFFLYHMNNQAKAITLLTRHSGDILNTLKSLKVDASIFTEIIHLKVEESKADFIKEEKGAIFIDNAFAERLEVANKLCIPVFDVDAVQSLINWQE